MKKLLFSMITCFMCLLLHAQIQLIEVEDTRVSSYADRMEQMFGSIDQSKVTTGYLKEFGVRFANIEACDGILTTNNHVTTNDWHLLYNSLYSMRIGTVASGMMAPDEIQEFMGAQANNASEDVVIAVQHYNYQQYKSNAYQNGDVTVLNNVINDVFGRNPYDVKTLFAATGLNQYIQGNTFTFKLPSNLVYTNSNLVNNQIQIDFDNGQGYQTAYKDISKSVTYTSEGLKTVKVKFSFTNGTTLESQFKVSVLYQAPNNAARYSGDSYLNFNGNLWFREPVDGPQWNGASARGFVTIELAEGHSQLTKPLIVIEGFDTDNDTNFFTFINGSGIAGLNIVIDNTTNTTLNEAIEDEGYDLVYIDYANGTDYIQRNAYMVQEVIRQVNQMKVGNEKNTVLGISMGGLVGRYALRDMEVRLQQLHETKLFISHDSPHQGANVPLSVQAMVRHLNGTDISLPFLLGIFNIDIIDFNNALPDLETALALVASPAAKQMLIYQAKGLGGFTYIDNNSLYHSFMNEYQALGYPVQGNIRNVAISNGSECSAPGSSEPYAPIVSEYERFDLPWFVSNITFAILGSLEFNPFAAITSFLSSDTDLIAELELRALPSLEERRIYRGRVFIRKKVLGIFTVDDH